MLVVALILIKSWHVWALLDLFLDCINDQWQQQANYAEHSLGAEHRSRQSVNKVKKFIKGHKRMWKECADVTSESTAAAQMLEPDEPGRLVGPQEPVLSGLHMQGSTCSHHCRRQNRIRQEGP